MIKLNGVKRVLDKLALFGRFVVLLTLLSCHVTIKMQNNIKMEKSKKYDPSKPPYHQYQPTRKYKPEKNELPSMTVPDDSFTIKDLLEKHTTGILPRLRREGLYQEDADIDNPPVNQSPQYDFAEAHKQHKEINYKISKLKEKQQAAGLAEDIATGVSSELKNELNEQSEQAKTPVAKKPAEDNES